MAVAVVPLCGEIEKQIHINLSFTHKQLPKWGAEFPTRGLTLLSLGALVPLISELTDLLEKGHKLCPEGEGPPGTLAKEGRCSQSTADFTRVPPFSLSRAKTLPAFWARALHWLHPNLNLTLIQRSFMLYQISVRLCYVLNCKLPATSKISNHALASCLGHWGLSWMEPSQQLLWIRLCQWGLAWDPVLWTRYCGRCGNAQLHLFWCPSYQEWWHTEKVWHLLFGPQSR